MPLIIKLIRDLWCAIFHISSIEQTSMYDMKNMKHSFAAHRLKDFTIVVSDLAPNRVTSGKILTGSDFKLCKKYPGVPPAGQEVDLDCSKELRGRYIYIYIPRVGYLYFCDVKVYGAGEKHEGVCHSNNAEICRFITSISVARFILSVVRILIV